MKQLFDILKPLGRIKKYGKGETGECILFSQWLRTQTLQRGFPFVWCHVANESIASPAFFFRQSWMGLVPGFPDYIFMAQGHCFAIEFKSASGRLSEKQKICQKWFASKSIPYYVARSYIEGITICEQEVILLATRLQAS